MEPPSQTANCQPLCRYNEIMTFTDLQRAPVRIVRAGTARAHLSDDSKIDRYWLVV